SSYYAELMNTESSIAIIPVINERPASTPSPKEKELSLSEAIKYSGEAVSTASSSMYNFLKKGTKKVTSLISSPSKQSKPSSILSSCHEGNSILILNDVFITCYLHFCVSIF